ncbi:uncharacterized protein LOC135071323 [Ostrinia nubilalis]|uniref:uncharacterized protein LOC135071323 n=1 Tax=Ostrinia nubilalis TaxID=29057 RepID=UPI0030823D21
MNELVLSPTDEDNVTLRHRSPRSVNLTSLCDLGTSSPETQTHHVNTLQNDTVADLKEYFSKLIHSQTESLRSTISELTDTIKKQNNRIEQLESRVHELESGRNDISAITSLEKRIEDLQTEIGDRDQALLSNDVEISGCPEQAGENSTHIVIALARKIGVELDEKDLVAVERAGPPRLAPRDGAPARPRPLAVRLTRRATRDALLRAARVRRAVTTEGLSLAGPPRPFYINERLTKHHRQLFQKARELARNHNFKYVWTREGCIFTRQAEGKPRHRLRSDADLSRVFGLSEV